MPRRMPFLSLLAAACLACAPLRARADEPKPPAPGGAVPPAASAVPPAIATNVQAKEAIAAFKEAFKAKDVEAKCDAIDALAKVQHPDVVAELAKLLTHKHPEIRATATQDMGFQKALPAIAGARLLATLEGKNLDWAYTTDAIDALKALKHRGSLPLLVRLIKHENHVIVRWAFDAIGDMKDVRGIEPILDRIRELKIDTAVRWDGVSVTVDTGAGGDGDQKAAEALGAALAAANKGKGKSGGRTSRALGEIVFLVLKDLTGQQFSTGKAAREWLDANKALVDERKQALDAEQKQQEEEAKAILAAVKAQR